MPAVPAAARLALAHSSAEHAASVSRRVKAAMRRMGVIRGGCVVITGVVPVCM